MRSSLKISPWKVLIALLLAGIACYIAFGVSVFPVAAVEVLRENCPNKKLDAVYIQSGAGAMASGDYLVYVLGKDQEPSKTDKAVFEGERVQDLELFWESDQKLVIQYGSADIRHFQNHAYPFPKDPLYKIEICEMQVPKK